MVSGNSLRKQAPGRSVSGQRIRTEVPPQGPEGKKEAKGQAWSVRVVAERQGTLPDRNGDGGTQEGKAQKRKMRTVIRSKANLFLREGGTL